MRVAGIVLLIIGVLMAIFTNINFTTKEKVVDLGPIQIDKEKEHSIGWPTYVGGLLALGGIGLIVAGGKKN